MPLFLDHGAGRFRYCVTLADPTLKEALENAPARARPDVVRPDAEYFVFRIDSLLMGVASEQVREVTRLSALTALPRVPSFVLGVAGHRGEVFPLVDLLRFLGQGESRTNARTRIFVAETQGYVVGFVADEVIGLTRVFLDQRLPPPAATGQNSEFIEGLVNSQKDGAMTLLNINRIMQSARAKVVAR